MKVRSDFVTNSSSSSFIMAFKDNDRWTSYDRFAERCNDLFYDSFYDLIESLQKCPENISKEKALETLYWYYSYEYRLELTNSLLKIENYASYQEYFKAKLELEESEEFKEKVKNHVNQNEEYIDKKKQIDEADLVVHGKIWDSNGGLLEWAIRNGFIENNFWHNNVMVWNVG